MSITTALEEAHWIYSRLEQYSKQNRFDAAVALAEWRVFSLRQIAKITGISHSAVATLVQSKLDKTGGKFDPEALAPLMALAKQRRKGEELDPALVAEALEAGGGTSPYMAARLTEIPRSNIVRRYKTWKERR